MASCAGESFSSSSIWLPLEVNQCDISALPPSTLWPVRLLPSLRSSTFSSFAFSADHIPNSDDPAVLQLIMYLLDADGTPPSPLLASLAPQAISSPRWAPVCRTICCTPKRPLLTERTSLMELLASLGTGNR
jgi:hypothetical protein